VLSVAPPRVAPLGGAGKRTFSGPFFARKTAPFARRALKIIGLRKGMFRVAYLKKDEGESDLCDDRAEAGYAWFPPVGARAGSQGRQA